MLSCDVHFGSIAILMKDIITCFLKERQGNSHIVMGKKRHFPVNKPKQSDKIMKKNEDKVLKKITTKGKDELKKAAVKVHKIKEDIPKKADKVKAKDQPEATNLKPKVVAIEKAVSKKEEDDSEESGEESKLAAEKDDENDDDDDDDVDDSNTDDDDDDNDDAQVSINCYTTPLPFVTLFVKSVYTPLASENLRF